MTYPSRILPPSSGRTSGARCRCNPRSSHAGFDHSEHSRIRRQDRHRPIRDQAWQPHREHRPFDLKADTPTEVGFPDCNPTPDTFTGSAHASAQPHGLVEPKTSFHTRRRPGRSFTFTVQADPHLNSKVEPTRMETTLPAYSIFDCDALESARAWLGIGRACDDSPAPAPQ